MEFWGGFMVGFFVGAVAAVLTQTKPKDRPVETQVVEFESPYQDDEGMDPRPVRARYEKAFDTSGRRPRRNTKKRPR